VVKIDVQGAELRVLSGMEQLFPQIETIYLEVHETKTGRYDTDTGDIEAYLRDHGFTLESLGTPSTKRGGSTSCVPASNRSSFRVPSRLHALDLRYDVTLQ